MDSASSRSIVELSPRRFLVGCVVAALVMLGVGRLHPLPVWLMGLEVMATVIGLFVFGSIRYRLDKNALTYGSALVVAATFWGVWWDGSDLRRDVLEQGWRPFWQGLAHALFTLEGLDELVHADTMLFILGLTFFVSVISQTRLLETVSFALLRWSRGYVVPTVAAITAIVSIASGILDGVSMIGLTIRTLAIILFLAGAELSMVVYAVLVSTVITTVCGMWLAYGEPPNLIMKSNLHPLLDDAFFLAYCLPMAVASYAVVAVSLHFRLRGRRIDLRGLDVLDVNAADVRFLQATRHGVVLSAVEFVEDHGDAVGEHREPVLARLRRGEPLGAALIAEGIDAEVRRRMLAAFVSAELAEPLDRHYELAARGDEAGAERADDPVEAALAETRRRRIQAQLVGGLAFIPFLSLLLWHAIDHDVRLFWASFSGFAVAMLGVVTLPRVRRLALREGRHEFAEYYFLFPLFLSITMMQTAGFFEGVKHLLHAGIEHLGAAHVAFVQFAAATGLSAILDNNVVADFAARALEGLNIDLVHLFAMAQIAGYALGGCWTHVGSAQSVVAFAFVQRDVDPHFTPFRWVRLITPLLAALFVVLTALTYLRAAWLF